MTPDSATSSSEVHSSPTGEDGQPVVHGAFTLSRWLAAPPDRAFSAFSDASLRQHWFKLPSETGTSHELLEFRVGGNEIIRGVLSPAGTPETLEYRAVFLDIAPHERLVFTYSLTLGGRPRLASLVTVELAPDGVGSHLTRTEQYALLVASGDGLDGDRLVGAARLQLNGLVSLVERSPEMAQQ